MVNHFDITVKRLRSYYAMIVQLWVRIIHNSIEFATLKKLSVIDLKQSTKQYTRVLYQNEHN